MQLSEDGTELVITNLKPKENLEYVYESDPRDVKKRRLENLNKNRCNHDEVDVNHRPNELCEHRDDMQF